MARQARAVQELKATSRRLTQPFGLVEILVLRKPTPPTAGQSNPPTYGRSSGRSWQARAGFSALTGTAHVLLHPHLLSTSTSGASSFPRFSMTSTLTRTPSATPSDASTSARTLSCLPPLPRKPSVGPSSASATFDPRRRLPHPPPSPARAPAPGTRAMAPPLLPPASPAASSSGLASFASSSGAGCGGASSAPAGSGTGGDASAAATSAAGPSSVVAPAAAPPPAVPAFPLPTPGASAPHVTSPYATRTSRSVAFAGSAAPRTSPDSLERPAPRNRGHNVIDLTSSSPPPSNRSRRLVPAAERSGLVFPGAAGAAGPSNVGATTSGGGHDTRPAEVLELSNDTDSDLEYADLPRGGGAGSDRWAERLELLPRGGSGGSGASGGRQAASETMELSDDSDLEIVSERPPVESLPRRLRVASPPPFIVPPGSTSTSTAAAGPSSNLRSRPSRFGVPTASTSNSNVDSTASDAAFARRLAAAEAAAARSRREYLDDDDEDERWAAEYVAAQQARYAGFDDSTAGGAGRGAGGRGRGGYGGIFSRAAGLGGSYLDQIAAALPQGMYAYAEGGFWPGGSIGGLAGLFGMGSGGGRGGYGGSAGPSAGWGGAAKVKAASKKYGVTMSHGRGGVEKGFSRDIIEPLEDGVAPPPPKKKAKTSAKGKAKAADQEVIVEEQVPVCASCLDPLFLGGEGARKVYALKCGHVVCAKCLDEAKERCRAAKGTTDIMVDAGVRSGKKEKAKGKRAVKIVAPATAKKENGATKGKGKSVAFTANTASDIAVDADFEMTPSELDALDGGAGFLSSELDFDTSSLSSSRPSHTAPAPAPSAKAKGKARSRSDETGIEEDWTVCPVASCDGKGGNVLAQGGWARPYELFV
ncbi:hypothetical protein JCM11251_001823 [Rhodosporidiobolus azoricus]